MNEPRPIDKARTGRVILAFLDQDRPRAEAVLQEAIDEGTFPELFDTTSGALLGMLRLAIGDQNLRQWASDWVLHAQMQQEAQSP